MASCLVCIGIEKGTGKEFTSPAKLSEKQIVQLCIKHKSKLRKIYQKYLLVLSSETKYERKPDQLHNKRITKIASSIMDFLAKEGSHTTEQIYAQFPSISNQQINEALYNLVGSSFVLRHDFKGSVRYMMNPENSPIEIEVIG